MKRKLTVDDLPPEDGSRANRAARGMLLGLIDAGYEIWESPQAMVDASKLERTKEVSQQAERTLSRYDYSQGPMFFLLQQIVRAMQDAGYPAKIVEFYRSPERQEELYNRRPRVTKARAYESAHQYMCAGDIVHETLGWNVTEDFWSTLASCVRIVADKFDVELEHGHHWRFRDSAHVQLKAWRYFAEGVGKRKPKPSDLFMLWEDTLPSEWQRYMQRSAQSGKRVEGGLRL